MSESSELRKPQAPAWLTDKQLAVVIAVECCAIVVLLILKHA